MNQEMSTNEAAKAWDLNERLLKALASNPETQKAVVEVINENGFITLIGEVDTPEARQAIRQIVANEPGVVSVVNSIKVTASSS